jgi:hypothetical protein
MGTALSCATAGAELVQEEGKRLRDDLVELA